MGLGFSRVVMGIDPGIKSFGICVLTDGTITDVYQRTVTKKEDDGSWATKFQRIAGQAMSDVKPIVIGLEDIEHQPWRTGGKTPTGIKALETQVKALDNIAKMRGITVYRQSPDILRTFEDVYIVAMLKKAMGKDYDVQPHLISATKHALVADADYRQARSQLANMEG